MRTTMFTNVPYPCTVIVILVEVEVVEVGEMWVGVSAIDARSDVNLNVLTAVMTVLELRMSELLECLLCAF